MTCHPPQIEFARLGIDHSHVKRKLRALVEEGRVSGWDDPVCPPSAACAASIRNFCERIGVAKSANVVEYGFWSTACGRI